jgi:hypothetical protein
VSSAKFQTAVATKEAPGCIIIMGFGRHTPTKIPMPKEGGGGGDSGGDLLGAIRTASVRSAAVGLCACLERTWVVTRSGLLCVVEHEGGGGAGGDRAKAVRCARRRQIRSVVAPQVRFGHWRVRGSGFGNQGLGLGFGADHICGCFLGGVIWGARRDTECLYRFAAQWCIAISFAHRHCANPLFLTRDWIFFASSLAHRGEVTAQYVWPAPVNFLRWSQGILPCQPRMLVLHQRPSTEARERDWRRPRLLPPGVG